MKLECDLCHKIIEVFDDRREGRQDMAQHLLEEHDETAFELIANGADDYFTEPDEDEEAIQ